MRKYIIELMDFRVWWPVGERRTMGRGRWKPDMRGTKSGQIEERGGEIGKEVEKKNKIRTHFTGNLNLVETYNFANINFRNSNN